MGVKESSRYDPSQHWPAFSLFPMLQIPRCSGRRWSHNVRHIPRLPGSKGSDTPHFLVQSAIDRSDFRLKAIRRASAQGVALRAQAAGMIYSSPAFGSIRLVAFKALNIPVEGQVERPL